jgi:hypothetical protein
MSTADTPEGVDFVVGADGSIPAEQLARRGLRPGDHLGLVPARKPPGPRKRVRGMLVGRISPEEVLTWEDFEAVHRANLDAAERRFGTLG